MSLPVTRTIQDVASALKDAKQKKQPCSVLIGAGCSATAKVPLADGIVKYLRKAAKNAYERAPQKTYPYIMRELDIGPRYDLIARYVEKATINWAHIMLAWLMRNGYVSRILTTNFDNLTLKACSLLRSYPSVYDLAVSPLFTPSLVRDPSVFFLHGQHNGFVQIHTPEEAKAKAPLLKAAFEDASLRRPWLVVGYSGSNDPVFENLAATSHFVNGLYWVGFKNQEPIQDVQTRLLGQHKQAYWVKGYDSDRFFIELVQTLKLPAPNFIADPFTHMLGVFDGLAAFPLNSTGVPVNPLAAPRSWLKEAQRQFVQVQQPSVGLNRKTQQHLVLAGKAMIEGNYGKAAALTSDAGTSKVPAGRATAAAAHLMQAEKLLTVAQATSGKRLLSLRKKAWEHFSLASRVSRGDGRILLKWGQSVLTTAHMRFDGFASTALRAAERILRRAVKADPRNPKPLCSLGQTIWDQAQRTHGHRARSLYRKAIQIYRQASRLPDNQSQSFGYLGNVLLEYARLLAGNLSSATYRDANAAFAEAVHHNPTTKLYIRWGVALAEYSKTLPAATAPSVFAEAEKAFRVGLRLTPNSPRSHFNWGNALYERAAHTPTSQASMYRRAAVHYAKATVFAPDNAEYWKRWGDALLAMSLLGGSDQRYKLLDEAARKYRKAIGLAPARVDALYSLARVLARRHRADQALKFLGMRASLTPSLTRAELRNDDAFDDIRQRSDFRAFAKTL